MEEQIFSKWLAMVGGDKTHPAYDETIAIAKFWTAIVTGKGLEYLKIELRKKDSKKQKTLRKRITNSSTRYVTEKIKTPYREVDRCDSIKEVIEHKKPDELKAIADREANFFGNESVDKFNDEYLLQYAAMDPNAFQLINIKPHDATKERPYCYPSIIQSKRVRDFDYTFNDLQFLAYKEKRGKHTIEQLWTKEYAYELTPAKMGKPNDSSVLVQLPKQPNLKLYIWTPEDDKPDGFIDIKMPQSMGGTEGWYVTRYEHSLGFVPAKQLGWVRSFEHKHDVWESFLLPAKERYIELYQKKSTYDVHLAVHGIAKQISYLPSCNYVSTTNQRCQSGKLSGVLNQNTQEYETVDCPKCKGSGLMPIHKSELDVVTIELPLVDGQVEIIDASKLHQYVEIPKHIIEMHKEAVKEASEDVALALFNTNVFKRAELTAATATEVIQNNKSVDNALYAYGSHRGAFKEFQLKCIATYLDVAEGFTVSIKYPADYKLETEDELYLRRKLALDAGMGPHFLQAIDMAILSKQNTDEPDKITYINSVNALRPFSDQTESERVALMSLLADNHPKKLALLYFDDVIYELDSNNKTKNKWYLLDKVKQKTLFKEALNTIIESYVVEPAEEDPTIAPFESAEIDPVED